MTTAETIVILIIFGVIASVLIGIVLHEFKVIARLKALKTFIISAFKPLTPLQKEIREEERTIKQLESQKADMERLVALKQEREKIFEEEGSKRHRLMDPKVWAELDSTIYENYRVMVDDVYKERARAERNDVWSEPDESYGDICADPTTMPDSVSSPHECPSCHTEAMMHYPGFKGYDWICHNCQYKYQYGRN